MMRIGRASSLSRNAASRKASSWSDMAGRMYHRAMNRFVVGSTGLALGLVAAIATAQDSGQDTNKRGWTIPPGAAQEANPIPASPEVIAKGKQIYEKNCQKCHGKSGKGDGPDAD